MTKIQVIDAMPGARIKRKRWSAGTGGRKRPRGSRYGRISRGLTRRLNVHHFKRTVQLTDILSSNPGAAGAYAFWLNQLPDVSDFSTLFDKYRINKILLKLVPAYTGSDVNPSTTRFTVPNIHSVIDYDDNNTPSSVTQLMQYSTYKMTKGLQTHTRIFRPAIQSAMYVSAVSTGYGSKWKQWIDMASLTVPHYGIKYWFDDAVANTVNWRVYVTFYFSCSGVR